MLYANNVRPTKTVRCRTVNDVINSKTGTIPDTPPQLPGNISWMYCILCFAKMQIMFLYRLAV